MSMKIKWRSKHAYFELQQIPVSLGTR